MLQVRHVKKDFGVKSVLKDVSFDINPSEVLAVCGPNGCGKSTLLKILSGELEKTGGSIFHPNRFSIASLQQFPGEFSGSALQFVLSTQGDVYPAYLRTQDSTLPPLRYAQAIDDYLQLGGFELEENIRAQAARLGMDGNELDRGFSTFSGGEKRLLQFVGLLVSRVNLVLMDEPELFLDIAMTLLLEQAIDRFRENGMGVLLVSHDRVLLDRKADRTLLLQDGKGIEVHGGYTSLVEHLQLEFSSRVRRVREIEKKITQLERDARQKMKWSNDVEKRKFSRGKPVEDRKAVDRGHLGRKSAKLAKRAKLSQKRAQAKVEELKSTRPFVPRPLRLSFPEYQVQSRPFLQAHDLSCGFHDVPLFEGVNVELTTRSRVGLVGPNGCGKTTLLRCLLGKLSPQGGEVQRNPGVRVFFLPQNLLGFFRQPVLLDNLLVYGVDQARVRNILGSALIRGESVFQRVETLSGGQRMRVAIVAAILAKADFLVLDEPTAHLDIESRQVLDEMLEAFPGGLLFVSHDRYFIARHAQTTYTMHQGQWQRLGFEWTLPPALEPVEEGENNYTEVEHE